MNPCWKVRHPVIEIAAVTDKPTICNPVHHGYWNLAGHDSGEVLGHRLAIDGAFYTAVDGSLIPTGEILSVRGTPFDFTAAKRIGGERGGDYDLNWVLAGSADRLSRAARALDPTSGRGFELWTDQPGPQFYSGAIWGPKFWAKADTPIVAMPASCSRPSASPIRRIAGISPRRGSIRVRPIVTGWSSGSSLRIESQLPPSESVSASASISTS